MPNNSQHLSREIYTKAIVEEYLKRATPIINKIKLGITKHATSKISEKQPLTQRISKFLDTVDKTIGVDRALLFGSTAKGKRKKTSDVDLIIISKAFTNIPHHERPGILENLWNYTEELESLTYTPEEFNQVKNRILMKEILSYAKDITPNKTKKAQT